MKCVLYVEELVEKKMVKCVYTIYHAHAKNAKSIVYDRGELIMMYKIKTKYIIDDIEFAAGCMEAELQQSVNIELESKYNELLDILKTLGLYNVKTIYVEKDLIDTINKYIG